MVQERKTRDVGNNRSVLMWNSTDDTSGMVASTAADRQKLQQLMEGANLFDTSETPEIKTLVSFGDPQGARIICTAPADTHSMSPTNRYLSVEYRIGENKHANVQIFLKPRKEYLGWGANTLTLFCL